MMRGLKRSQQPLVHPGAVEDLPPHGPRGTHPIVTPDGWVRLSPAPWTYPHDFAAPATPHGTLTLRLRTPTHVRRGPDPRGSTALADLVEDLQMRVSLLARAYGPGPVHTRDEERAHAAAAAEAIVDDAALRWEEVPRYSRNQERAMTFGGWTGWVRYTLPAPDAPYLPLLRAARLLHAGKHTTFGFGAVEVDEHEGSGLG